MPSKPSESTQSGALCLWWLGSDPVPPWVFSLAPEVKLLAANELPTYAHWTIIASDADAAMAVMLELDPRYSPRRCLVLARGLTPTAELALLKAGAWTVADGDQPELAEARFRSTLAAAEERSVLAPDERRQQALSLASYLLSTLSDQQETFQRLVEILARELNSRRISLMQLNRDQGVLEMRCAVGIPAEIVRVARAKVGEGIAGTCALLGKPLFVDDPRRAKEAPSELQAFVPDGADYHQLPMSLTVPILVRGEVVGVVNITDRADSQPYSRGDIDFVQSLMGHAGFLLENAELMRNLEQLRAFSEKVINTISDPLAVITSDLQIISHNQRFGACFGDSVGRGLFEVVDAEPEPREALTQIITGDGLTSAGLEDWQLADRLYDVRVDPFGGPSDTIPRQFLVFMRDVTGRRQMERRLVSAEKMASLGVLAAGVAHEINNPIAFVKANTRQVREYFSDLFTLVDQWRNVADGKQSALDARRMEQKLGLADAKADIDQLVTESVRGIERVELIVSSLKGFAHPDTQKAHAAELQDLVNNAVLLTESKWKYKLKVNKDYEPTLAIHCLPTQLEQVFMNLIVNAAQAAKGFKSLTIRVREAEHGVMAIFEDDCGGIPPGIVDRIFEPFFTTKDIGEGTGLGLAISHNIVQGHGGNLRVETDYGQGTRFIVEIPRGEAGVPLVVKQQSRFRI